MGTKTPTYEPPLGIPGPSYDTPCYENPGMAPRKRQRGIKCEPLSFVHTIVHSPVFSSWQPFEPYPIGVLSPYVGHWWPVLPSVSLGSKAPCGKVEKFQPFHCQVGAPKLGFLWKVSRSPHPARSIFFIVTSHFFNAFLVNSLCVNESFWTPDNIKGGCGSISPELRNLRLVELAVGLQES